MSTMKIHHGPADVVGYETTFERAFVEVSAVHAALNLNGSTPSCEDVERLRRRLSGVLVMLAAAWPPVELKVMVSAEEKAMLQNLADDAGLSVADVVRQLIRAAHAQRTD